ncbi:MAG: iron-containing alcohol dehydrogenase [Sporolactobacillus sp.]
MSNFYLKTKIVTDAEADRALAELKGCRIWIGCDGFLTQNPTVLSMISQLKSKNQVLLYSDIVPEPPIEKVAAGVASVAAFHPSLILAIGGGSAIDTAKAVRYFAEKKYGMTIDKFYAMPTTSGTGSEVTNIAVVSDTKEAIKYPLSADQLTPDMALLKSELSVTCPPSVTAFSGMDVLTHALEALVAKGANGFSDALAEKAVEMVFAYLPACYTEGNNLQNRSLMHEASCIAGCAFQNAGLGITHSLAHQIGSLYHIPHGLATSLLLPHVVRYNAGESACLKKYARLARKIRISDWEASDETSVERLVQAVIRLSRMLHCPQTLTEFGVQKKAIAEKLGVIVEKAMQDFTFKGNPIEPTKEDLVRIILAIV